jgi:hypothetical protein
MCERSCGAVYENEAGQLKASAGWLVGSGQPSVVGVIGP